MQKIVLNVIPDGVCPKVYVNQFDIGRQFQIKFKEDSITYDAPNGLTFKINGRKADNHVFEYTESDKYDDTHYVITKSGSGTSLAVVISTTEQMTAAAGDANVQLTFKDSANRVLGTLNFILAVQERPASVGDPSESDLPDIVRSVNGITPDADGDVQLGATGTAAIGAANISPVEQTRVMTSAHAAHTHVYVAADDQRYLIGDTALSQGATLTPGTNANARMVDQDIEELTSHLTSVENNVKAWHFTPEVGANVTDISVNSGDKGKTLFVIISQQTGAGDNTASLIGMLRCGYSGNNVTWTLIAGAFKDPYYAITFSANSSGYLVITQAGAKVSHVMIISNRIGV